jgi:hypothetical protein
MAVQTTDWWYALYAKQRAGQTREIEDWYLETRLVLAPADPMLSGEAFDLVELPLTDNGTGSDDAPPPVISLTTETAAWLRDALTAALAGSDCHIEDPHRGPAPHNLNGAN